MGCAGNSDYSQFPVVRTVRTGVVLVSGDQVVASWAARCPEGSTTCADPSISRVHAVGSKVYAGDQAAGRLFVLEASGGNLSERPRLRGRRHADRPLPHRPVRLLQRRGPVHAMSALAIAVALVSAAAGTPTTSQDVPRWLGHKPQGPVRRVVTLAPSLTETVLMLGAGERLVGVSRFDELPEVKALPRVGGFVDPSVEAVLGLRPDLVLVQPSPGAQQAVEKMAELGTPVLLLPLHTVDQCGWRSGSAGRRSGASRPPPRWWTGSTAPGPASRRGPARSRGGGCCSSTTSNRWWWRGPAPSPTSCSATRAGRTPPTGPPRRTRCTRWRA